MIVNLNMKQMTQNEIINMLIQSINLDMNHTYCSKLNTLEAIKKADIEPSEESIERIRIYEDNINELEGVIEIVSEALDRALKPQTPIRTSKIALCPTCHHRINPKHSFCHRCGQKIRKRDKNE